MLKTPALSLGNDHAITGRRFRASAGGPTIINNANASAFRGFGINQPAVAIESLLDEAARKLELDPFEIRLRNALEVGDRTISGEILKVSVATRATIEAARDALQHELPAITAARTAGRRIGIGVASGFKNVGAGKGKLDDAGAIFILQPDGRIMLRASAVDMGQGIRTAPVQVAAHTLDLDGSIFDIITADTALTIRHGGAVGERQTLISGKAVELGALEFKTRLLQKAAGFTGVPAESLRLKGREVVNQNGEGVIALVDLATRLVDEATGKVKVLKIIAAHDCGRAINPLKIEGQIEGSCAQGMGYALSEAYVLEKGIPVTRTYKQLGVPKITDTPEIHCILIEDPEPGGPFGAKGISEVATVPITPAILNAIYDAVGVRITRLPATPDKILANLRQLTNLS